MSSSESCDRCGASIIADPFDRPRAFQFVHERPADDDTVQYESEARQLCTKCEEELLEWIDGDDAPDRSDRVDLPTAVQAGRTLRSTAAHLEEVADSVEASLADGEHHVEVSDAGRYQNVYIGDEMVASYEPDTGEVCFYDPHSLSEDAALVTEVQPDE